MDNTKLKGRMSGKVQELQQPAGNQAITVALRQKPLWPRWIPLIWP